MHHGIPLTCHCEAPKGPWQSRAGSCVFADGFPVIHHYTARFPRRFAPRNDKLGGIVAMNLCHRTSGLHGAQGAPLQTQSVRTI